MLVSIKAILLSGTGALVAAGVAAGLGAGVGVVCGRVWPTTAKVIEVIKTNVAKITFFIASPQIVLTGFYPQITQITPRRKKAQWIGSYRRMFQRRRSAVVLAEGSNNGICKPVINFGDTRSLPLPVL